MTPKRLPQQPLPQFRVDEKVELKGVSFTIQRINRSNIVLRPVKTGAQRARDIIYKLSYPRDRDVTPVSQETDTSSKLNSGSHNR